MKSLPAKALRHSSTFLLVWSLLAGIPAAAVAGDVKVQSDTIFRFFERDTASSSNAKVLPVYEYLQADFGKLDVKGVSLHLYGWGRADLGDGGYYRDDTRAHLTYAFLQYSGAANNFDLRLGRQYIFEGVASASIDGVRLATDLGPYFSLSAYGGWPVAFDTIHGRSGDSIYGGRLSHHLGNRYDVAISYQKGRNDGTTEDQRLGIDVALALPAGIGIDGRSTYNLETDGWGEHFYQAHFNYKELQLRPFFEKIQYRDFFASGGQTPNPFRFLQHGAEGLTDYGAEATWSQAANWEFGAKAKFYQYDVSHESAGYYAALATWHGAALTQVGGEVGYLKGDPAHNDYLIGRLFGYWDQPGGLKQAFVSGDVVYAAYDQAFFGEDRSIFLALGVGQRFLADRLALKLSGDYSADPNFTSDLRGMLVASYRFGQ